MSENSFRSLLPLAVPKKPQTNQPTNKINPTTRPYVTVVYLPLCTNKCFGTKICKGSAKVLLSCVTVDASARPLHITLRWLTQ